MRRIRGRSRTMQPPHGVRPEAGRGVAYQTPMTSGTSVERVMTNLIDQIDAASLRDDVPDFRAGDTLKVHVKVVEGSRTRTQVFQGVVIARQGGGVSETFTVRKISFGIGVERTFPVHTPTVERIEVVTRGDVRRAKLYYLRNLRGQAAKFLVRGER